MRKGEIYYAALGPIIGSEQGGIRPVVVIQNDMGNRHSPTTIVAPMTTQNKTRLPTHVSVTICGKQNTILLEQIRSISRIRLIFKYGELSDSEMDQVKLANPTTVVVEQPDHTDPDKPVETQTSVIEQASDKES